MVIKQPNLTLINEFVLRFLEMMQKVDTKKIQFHYLAPAFAFDRREPLKVFLYKLFRAEKRKFDSLQYIFCSDPYLLEINNKFLHHDFYTDIITFNLSDNPSVIIGEIYISIDRVRDNSKLLSESFKKELHRVIFHGALHLCGYKDKTPQEIALMRQKETECLTKYFK